MAPSTQPRDQQTWYETKISRRYWAHKSSLVFGSVFLLFKCGTRHWLTDLVRARRRRLRLRLGPLLLSLLWYGCWLAQSALVLLVDAVVRKVASHPGVVADVLSHQSRILAALRLGTKQPGGKQAFTTGVLVTYKPEPNIDEARQEA